MVLQQSITLPKGFPITAPDGSQICIPDDVEAGDPYSARTEGKANARYFNEHGYVVLRKTIPEELCETARAAFVAEVRPYDRFLYRQATADPERHVWTAAGYMLNSLLNIQDLPSRRFPRFCSGQGR